MDEHPVARNSNDAHEKPIPLWRTYLRRITGARWLRWRQ